MKTPPRGVFTFVPRLAEFYLREGTESARSLPTDDIGAALVKVKEIAEER